MDVLMGLLAALLWGGTDFLVGLNARAVGVKRAVYFGQAQEKAVGEKLVTSKERQPGP